MKPAIHYVALLLLLSCQPDISPSHRNFWDCHHRQTWSAADVAARLVGSWAWQYVGCELIRSDELDRGLSVTFRPNGMLTVLRRGNVVNTATWEVVPTDGVLGLRTTPNVGQLNGRILFCRAEVVFNNSSIDGCDNQFARP